MSGSRVYVHIGALTLRGFAAAEGEEIVAGLRTELARQFATGHAAMASRSVTSLSGGRMALAHGASASHIGREAARRIVRSVRA